MKNNRTKFITLLAIVFLLISFFYPIDVLQFRRQEDKNIKIKLQNSLLNKKPILLGYGYGNQLIHTHIHYRLKEMLKHAPHFVIRYLIAFPFFYIALYWPSELQWTINILLLLPFIVLIRDLIKTSDSNLYLLLPFLMFFISLRSLLPGVFIALFIVKPSLIRALFLAIVSFTSTAVMVITVLFFMVEIAQLNRNSHRILALFILISLFSIWTSKGFYFGQVTTQKHKFDSTKFLLAFKQSVRKSAALFFIDWVKKDVQLQGRPLRKNYKFTCMLKLIALVVVLIINVFIIFKLFQLKLKKEILFYSIPLLFFFLEGYGYSCCFVLISVGLIRYIICEQKPKEVLSQAKSLDYNN